MRVMIKRAPDGKISLQETAKIAIVTINRPDARNALTKRMWGELAEIGRQIQSRPKNKVVILRGISGNFTAGSDIKEFCQMSVTEANEAFECMEETISIYENLPIPVIGALDGPSIGAGFVLSLACDLRVGTPLVSMGIPVSRLGIKLSPSFVRRIASLVGPSYTKEMVFTNEIYDSDKSEKLGLLNKVVSSTELDRYTISLAEYIGRQSRASLNAVKEAIDTSSYKNDMAWDFVDPDDFHEGCLAFVEKRYPNFK
ncbi:enoyl-CoA hydratase-related protein [Aquibacillus sp. 3ASR75-11]|uniref:Enoyl-CoA hydratase-related protein n=1 Tax=Terrihalobacillus insolitus TaxID=2950438 RepID=A0A9X4ALR8_9BACI|nr:enoyl-CoA hydratase-related protein [Terrihalobacillus insolitus]MDC3415124.1 enoyl-CoA hydratase-related protein [Terrihalobacillus insolitus]MDC3424044.1 enoyl-CoA hydratase-related protein [Terrihalobacillus insolitus]